MLSNNSEYHSYLFTHFCPLGDKRMAITIEKRTVKVPKKTNAFIDSNHLSSPTWNILLFF